MLTGVLGDVATWAVTAVADARMERLQPVLDEMIASVATPMT